ncbi:hypothetical protein ACJMK2_043346 [Sinanodonta woodiana]|uniref:Uncharacterized protein n=1 Tax=Sinanodonta woodiana TaxID=1069815 RepID=A0ABD3W078_SINWO
MDVNSVSTYGTSSHELLYKALGKQMESKVTINHSEISERDSGVGIEENSPTSDGVHSSLSVNISPVSDRKIFISAIEKRPMTRRVGVTDQQLPEISPAGLPSIHMAEANQDNEKEKADRNNLPVEMYCIDSINNKAEISRETNLGFPGSIDNSNHRDVSEILVQTNCILEKSEALQDNRLIEYISKKVPFNESHPDQPILVQPYFIIQDCSAPRKISNGSYGYHFNPGSRKSSIDAVYLAPSARGHKISVFSLTSEGSIPESDMTFNDALEALPHPDHYRDLVGNFVEDIRQRPTLYQLREKETFPVPTSPSSATLNVIVDELVDEAAVNKPSTISAVKFGWIQGVLIRCILNIFGVMLFLRLTWIAGQAGVGLATVIVLMSTVVTTITTMSMSAICTNGEVKGGGVYYMISRSLGPEFGAAIGVVFSLASALGAAMHIVGFAETVRDLMWEHDTFVTGDLLHEVRIIGAMTCLVLLAIVMIGLDWEAKAQFMLLIILTVALANYFVGTFLPPSSDKKWKGVAGYNGEVFTTNFGPGFTEGNSFFSVFAIYFPSATGILAGANISGDLKNPQKAIPKGTFLAILITSMVYLAIIWTSGGCLLREAIGPAAATVIEFVAGNWTTLQLNPDVTIVTNCSQLNGTCKYGTLHDNGIAGLVSPFRPLIIAGIFSATLSSALASMVSAPKVFQALGKDELFPCIKYFAKGYGPGGEPRRGYILAFGISLAAIGIGSLDAIAPIISNFFLMSYALVNYSCFNASMANTPGFRPAFRYYNKWTSLLGALLCLAFMFLCNWWAALVTFVIVAALYIYVKYKKPGTMQTLNINSLPQILVLTGFPSKRADLVDFCSAITKRQSLLACGHILEGDMSEHLKHPRATAAYRWFKSCKVKAFYNSVAAPTFRLGVQVFLQAFGLGKLRPNTIILGFKSDWQTTDPRKVYDYYHVIQDAFDLNFGVGILSIPGGCDRKEVPDGLSDMLDQIYESDEEGHSSNSFDALDNDPGEINALEKDLSMNTESVYADPSSHNGTIKSQKLKNFQEGVANEAFEQEDREKETEFSTTIQLKNTPSDKPPIEISEENTRRFRKTQYGTIDVWWLYDDGGLTLLIPYILSQRKRWKNCRLRVFGIGTKKENVVEDEKRMASLLSKFRIEYSQLTIISDLSKKPQLSTYKDFEGLIHKWRLRHDEFHDDCMWKISDADLLYHKERTYRNLRLREELKIYSTEASLIVMSLPTPRKVQCPAGLYMGWLEMLTRGMPPTLLLRGNQQSVLTYYS